MPTARTSFEAVDPGTPVPQGADSARLRSEASTREPVGRPHMPAPLPLPVTMPALFIEERALRPAPERRPDPGNRPDMAPTPETTTSSPSRTRAASADFPRASVHPFILSDTLHLPPAAGDGRAALSHGDTSNLMLVRLLQWYADRVMRGWREIPPDARRPVVLWQEREIVQARILRTAAGPTGNPGIYVCGRRDEGNAAGGDASAACWTEIEPGVLCGRDPTFTAGQPQSRSTLSTARR